MLDLIAEMNGPVQKESSLSTQLGKQLRIKEFDLDEDCVFCNSGSWSCVPRRFIARQHQLIQERERNNAQWALLTEPKLIYESLEALAKFVGANVDNITFTSNATEGTNTALKSQQYKRGDKILLCNVHTYNAVFNQAKIIVNRNEGVELVTFDIPFPIRGIDDIISAYSRALQENPGVKITVINHISSSTAVLFPIKEIIELCHQYEVITVVDGAHAPGHTKLTIEDYRADYYVGNLCKWMMLPQSVGFLWVAPKYQAVTQPLATSHNCFEPYFRDRFYQAMTKDQITHILVKDAVEFINDLGGLEHITARNSELTTRAVDMLSRGWNTQQLDVSIDRRAPHMAILPFPDDLVEAYSSESGEDIYHDLLLNGVSVKVSEFDGKTWCRISCQVWNDWEDFELLCERVKSLAKIKKSRLSKETRPKCYIPAAS